MGPPSQWHLGSADIQTPIYHACTASKGGLAAVLMPWRGQREAGRGRRAVLVPWRGRSGPCARLWATTWVSDRPCPGEAIKATRGVAPRKSRMVGLLHPRGDSRLADGTPGGSVPDRARRVASERGQTDGVRVPRVGGLLARVLPVALDDGCGVGQKISRPRSRNAEPGLVFLKDNLACEPYGSYDE